MVIAVSNPLGQAMAYLMVPKLVPSPSTHREIRLLLLIIASMTMTFSLAVFGIRNKPPTPPSSLCEISRPSLLQSWKILLGLHQPILSHHPQTTSNATRRGSGSRRATITVVRRHSAHQFELDHPHPRHDQDENDHHHHQSHPIHNIGTLTQRLRVDFALLTVLFGILVGQYHSLSITKTKSIDQVFGFDHIHDAWGGGGFQQVLLHPIQLSLIKSTFVSLDFSYLISPLSHTSYKKKQSINHHI